MNQRIMKSILFVVILGIMLWPINKAFVETNGYRHLNDTDKFMNVPDGLQVINLGSSHGLNGFDYSKTDVKGYNMALPAQGFYYDYRILQQYHQHLEPGAVVLIPISYFSPYQAYEGEKFDQFNKRYYRFLEPSSIRFFKPWEYLRYKTLPVLFAGEHIKYLFEDRPTLKADWEMIDYNKFGMDGIVEEGCVRANHHIETIIKTGQSNKDFAMNELRKTIEFCFEEGYQPILITTPLHMEYKKHYDNGFLEAFSADIEALQNGYQTLLYMDYSECFPDRTDLFMDSDHLNLKGREIFTEMVLDELKEKGLL